MKLTPIDIYLLLFPMHLFYLGSNYNNSNGPEKYTDPCFLPCIIIVEIKDIPFPIFFEVSHIWFFLTLVLVCV